MVDSLVEKYSNEIALAMNKRLNYDPAVEIPKIDKIVLDMGVGDAVSSAKNLDEAVEGLTLISGQESLATRAKKSVVNLRLHEGVSIGAKVTLRGDGMHDLLYKLTDISLPRVHDFRRINFRLLDGRGNYTLGIKGQLIFPEIDYDEVNRVRGLGIAIVITTDTGEEAHEFLTEFGMSFTR